MRDWHQSEDVSFAGCSKGCYGYAGISTTGNWNHTIERGKLEAGEARNTIPAPCKMIVETRGETGELNTYMKEQALSCIERAAKEYGVTYEVQFQGESVSAASDEALSQKVLAVAKQNGCFSDYMLTKDFGCQ